MTLSSLDLGLPHWEVVGILTAGLALSSFAISGTELFETGALIWRKVDYLFVIPN